MITSIETKIDVMFDLASREVGKTTFSGGTAQAALAGLCVPLSEVHRMMSRLRDDVRRVAGG